MSNVELNNLSIGYVPYSKSLNAASDRRRFVFYAKESKLNFEIYSPNKKFDLVVATTQADPKLLLSLPKSTKLIFDFADPFMAESPFSIAGLLRGLIRFYRGSSSKFYLNYKDAFIDIMKRSSVVICSSLEQKKIILPFCKNVKIILDSHINECYKVKKNFQIKKKLNIGWEGNHATMPSLLSLIKEISKTNLFEDINFHIVTDDKPKNLDKFLYGNSVKQYLINKKLNIYFYPWSIENLNNLADICDFAIIPVNLNNPMHCLKPENRLHIFWRLGLPVIASSTEANIRAMKKCKLDLIAKSSLEFVKKIELFRKSPEFIYENSHLALNYINSNFTSDYFIEIWTKALKCCFD